jgi:hypothetical protein
MKRMIESVSRQYDEAYHKAQALFDEYNPCQVKVHVPGKVTCIAYNAPGPLCCPGCRYHSPNGCTVMNLACKFHLCGNAGEHKEFRDKLHAIELALTPLRYAFFRIRCTKEELMEDVAWHIRDMLLFTSERKITWNALDVPGM